MYSYINNKYNRLLYYLLGIYIILVFVFFLLLNDFFVCPKAYKKNDSMNVSYSLSATGAESGTATGNIKFNTDNDNSRGVWVSIDALDDIIENSTASYLNLNSCSGYVFLYRGTSPTSTYQSNSGYAFSYNLIPGRITQEYRQYMENLGFVYDNYNQQNDMPIPSIFFGATFNWGTVTSLKVNDDLQYINNTEDLKKFFINNDDSVVKVGDPDNPSQEVDSQIPTPQKVAVYKDSTSPSLVWSNPKGIDNNENVKVKIEWKPVITLTHGLYDVHSIIGQDYELLYYDDIGTYNSFCTLNNNGSPPPNVLNSYNTIYDSKVLYSGTGAQQSNDWANYYIVKNNVNWVTRVDPFGTNDLFGKGTYSGVRVPDLKYRLRYETETGVSDWIYSDREFDSDNVSGPSQHSSTHSRNASGEPVSNPTYTPNNDNKIIPQNEVDEQDDPDKKKSNSIFDFISGFFDTIINAITAIFDKLKEIVDSISTGTGSFFSFFADLFGAFPQLLGIFLLGLVVTVLLRVLGR